MEEGMTEMRRSSTSTPLTPEARRDVQRYFEIRPLNQNKLAEDKVRDGVLVAPTIPRGSLDFSAETIIRCPAYMLSTPRLQLEIVCVMIF